MKVFRIFGLEDEEIDLWFINHEPLIPSLPLSMQCYKKIPNGICLNVLFPCMEAWKQVSLLGLGCSSFTKNVLMVSMFGCSQTSNNHLYKTTTHLRWPVLSLPKQIPIQLLLHQTTTCLTQPANTFCLANEKNLSKMTATKLYPGKKWEMHRK